jgi:RNA polymerase sigma factor (sigma-70 family)
MQPSEKKASPPSPTKELFIGPETGASEQALKKLLPIVEMVVRKEYKSIPSYLAEYGELINVGLLAVNKLLIDVVKSKKTYNSSYIAQAVKWAIKDDLRSRYNWYGVRQSKGKEKEEEYSEKGYQFEEIDGEEFSEEVKHTAQEKVFETILYLDDLTVGNKAHDEMTPDELAKLELVELKAAIKRAIDKLPEKHKKVIELRFYEHKKGNDVAAALGVTPSRVSHMISDAIEKVKQSLSEEGFS